jgi:hypothetical protein
MIREKNIGFNRLRPETLVPAYEQNIGHLWIQFRRSNAS